MQKNNNKNIRETVKVLGEYVQKGFSSGLNYEKLILVDKAPYLDAFVEDSDFPPFEVEIQMSSNCNLSCSWCIGKEIQDKNNVLHLPNYIKNANIDKIVDGILEFRENDLSIEKVKFSGFIGEPLLPKETTIRAIQRLAGAGKKVGLFTNGVLMDDDKTISTLANIDYVHISLDGGPKAFYFLKESSKGIFGQGFKKVIENITKLANYRRQVDGSVKINIGYVIIPGNHFEIYEATKWVKEAGADSIRFKCDIGGKHDLQAENLLDEVFEAIEEAKKDFDDPPSFSVYEIHSKEDIRSKAYGQWQCKDGCYYHNFLGTVGSDGNLYLCDHNTMPGAIPLGNAINDSFESVWKSKRRNYLANGVEYTCQCNVCPPFGNRVNNFLQIIEQFKKRFGIDCVKEAIKELRIHIKNSSQRFAVQSCNKTQQIKEIKTPKSNVSSVKNKKT